MSSVKTYANDDRHCYCQIKFDSGERVLVSIASIPTPSIKITRLGLGGLIPRQTIWEFNAIMAGGHDSYVKKLVKMFRPDPKGPAHPLDMLRDILLSCSSIDDARKTLSDIEFRIIKKNQKQHKQK